MAARNVESNEALVFFYYFFFFVTSYVYETCETYKTSFDPLGMLLCTGSIIDYIDHRSNPSVRPSTSKYHESPGDSKNHLRVATESTASLYDTHIVALYF